MSDNEFSGGRRRRRGNGGDTFSPLSLFASGEQGVWYDPSDLTPEKTSWRRNLLTYSENFENVIWTKTNASLLSNLALYSQDFDNAAWSKTNVTVTANAVTAPDGTTTADKIEATTAAATTVLQNVGVVNATTVTFSFYGKQGSGATDANKFDVYNVTTLTDLAVFNVNWTTGAVTVTSGSATTTSTDVGNGWWRITTTVSSGITSGNSLRIYTAFAGNAETANEFSYLWGAQLVVGSSAQTYTRSLAATAPVVFSDPLGGTMAEKYVPASTFGLTVNTTTGCPIRRTSAISGVAAGYAVSFSTYAKAAEYNRIILYVDDGLITKNCVVSLVDGSVVSVSSDATCTVTSVGSGWYRINIAYTFTSAGTASGFRIAPQDSVATTGDGVSGIYIYGAQVEQASTASAYQRITDFTSEFIAAFPNHALYQDPSGVTPVTALGQSVGLVLDKRLGGVSAGTSVYTNSGSSTSGWTYLGSTGGSIVTSYGQLILTCANTITTRDDRQAYYAFSTVVGTTYGVTITFAKGAGSGSALVGVVSSTAALDTTIPYAQTTSASPTTTILFFTATTTTSYLRIMVTSPSANSVMTASGIAIATVPGNHALQATAASRPTIQARSNLLTYSDQFDNVAWTKTNSSVTANAGVAPDGTTTADKLVEAAIAGFHQAAQSIATAGIPQVLSVYAKAVERTQVTIQLGADAATFNLSTGAVVSGTDATITSAGSGWYRCSIAKTPASANVILFTANGGTANYTGDGTSGILIWGAQLESAAAIGNYQRVVAATDYADIGLPRNLLFDGVDDSLATTGNVDLATWTGNEARRNLFTVPTMFDDAAWTSVGTPTVTANTTLAPDGTTTADTINDSSAIESQGRRQTIAITGGTTTSYVASVYILKTSGTPTIFPITNLRMTGGTTVDAYIALNTTTGETVTSGAVSGSAVDAGTYWRVTLVAANNGTANTSLLYTVFPAGATTLTTTLNVAATGSQVFWGAQLETGSTATAFQNVGTDKVSLFSGLTKASDAAAGQVVELSADSSANNGSFGLTAPTAAAATTLRFRSTGTLSSFSTDTSFAAPVTGVITGLSEILTDTCILRKNGTQVATSASDQGTGTYLSYPLYIGRRNNTNLPFNGRIFQLIIRGAATDSVTVINAEQYVAQRTGVTL